MVRVILAAALLCMAGCDVPSRYGEATVWETTCELVSAYDEVDDACDGIDPPEIDYKVMKDGMQGYYDGENVITLNSDLRSVKKRRDRAAIMLHEMVHYLDKQYYGLSIPGTALEVCFSEARAYDIESEYTKKDFDKWWTEYPHCWKFYSTGPTVTLYVQSKEE